eukprot:GHVN01078006.1.p1 GENE.GHVN01078006.1~~GHVN01078006.1.p1  ORF type:complete len:122 (+),score=22.48 GHVN01078006.1:339-704(+)
MKGQNHETGYLKGLLVPASTLPLRGEGRFALAKLRDKLRKLTEENQSFSVLLAERNQPLQLNCSTQQKQDEYWAQQLRTLYELTSELTEEEEQLQQMSHELTEVLAENRLLQQQIKALRAD